MYLDCYEEVRRLTKELVSIPSIVREPQGETNCARYIYEYYMGLDYFQRHPEQARLIQTENDFVERHSAYAYVKGTKGTSSRTVILIGHIDTVGVDDYGVFRDFAFDPDHLPEKLLELDIGEEVRADIASGEYMFGRGALDMKSGVAGHMYLIKYFSEHPEELDGNLIAYAECDEEDNSHGILTGLKEFKRLKEKEGFDYIACINADYSTGYNLADINRYIYFGSIGKLLPSFYVRGKETHVGQAYGGLDPNLILSELTRLMELNTDLCDEAQGEVTVPPISLKQADFKEGYTVQTALAGYAYYNFFTHSMSPVDVMAVSRQKAVEAFGNVIRHVNASYRRYCEKSHVDYEPLPWKSRVYTWEEYCDYLERRRGPEFREHIFRFAQQLNADEPALDLRLFSVRVIEEACRWDEDKSPHDCGVFRLHLLRPHRDDGQDREGEGIARRCGAGCPDSAACMRQSYPDPHVLPLYLRLQLYGYQRRRVHYRGHGEEYAVLEDQVFL